MANAKKCDICGRYYDAYNIQENEDEVNGLMFLNIDYASKYISHKPIDCCQDCMKSIKNHIDVLRNGEGLEKNDKDGNKKKLIPKFCADCAYNDIEISIEPCKSCKDYCNWRPKN